MRAIVKHASVRLLVRQCYLCLLALNASLGLAHEARPVAIELVERAPNTIAVSMKIPNVLPLDGLPQLALPHNCEQQGDSVLQHGQHSYLISAHYRCAQSLSGQRLSVAYPNNQANTNTLFRLHLYSGQQFSQLLAPTEHHWQVPLQASTLGVVRDYTKLGVAHIITGVDHLLFIACLMFIAGRGKRLVITISGFTLAHSVTLCLAALNIVTVAIAPVEAAIALSILLLAHEIAVNNRNSWTWRYPVAVASSFGLLHGFGFAAMLQDIGLPQGELLTALLCFNLGVELGQLGFIALLLLVAKGWSRRWRQLPPMFASSLPRLGAIYAIGTTAAFWFISRLLAF